MKKHKLLEKAMQEYPKGTPISWGLGPFFASGEYHINRGGEVEGKNREWIFNGLNWAEIVKDERVPLLVSEDGVDLFDGDYYVCVKSIHGLPWSICFDNSLGKSHFVLTDKENCKAFSTRESADAWIKENNKPKEIKISLYYGTEAIICDNLQIKIMDSDKQVTTLSFGDVKDLFHQIKDL